MRQERLNFGVILRVIISLVPILFGMPVVSVIMCAYNIAMSFIVFGPLTSFVSSLCAVCISMFFYGTFGENAKLEGLFLALEAVLCASGCIYTVLKKKSFYNGVWISAGGFLLPNFLSLRNAAMAAGMSISRFLGSISADVMELEFDAILSQAPENLDVGILTEAMKTATTVMVSLLPAILIIVSVVIGYIVMWCVCEQLRKFPASSMNHSFAEIHIPKSMVIVMAVSLAAYIADIQSIVSVVALNVFVILLAFSFFAGVSYVESQLRRVIKSKFIRAIIYIFICLQFFPAFMLLAVIDSFANFRKLPLNTGKRGDSCETEERNA